MEDEEALLQGSVNPDVQVEVEDEIQDWRNLSKVKDTSLPKRGEKDYEPDGTDIQQKILQDSRDSMFEALAGARGHVLKQHVRAVWIPSVRRALIEKPKGSFLQTCGVVDPQNKCWLRPEEFCYLAERGTIEPWFEEKDVAMSIQAVYACCFEDEDEIDEYHVYAYLKRHGFIVMKNDPTRDKVDQLPIRHDSSSSLLRTSVIRNIYDRIISIVSQSPLIKTINTWLTRIGINNLPSFHPSHFTKSKYTNYSQIYNSIKLIPFHKVKDQPRQDFPSHKESIQISFDIWKPDPKFSKKSPPSPDFQVIVRNTNKYKMPTLSQLRDVFQRTTIKNQDVEQTQQQRRLKNGYRYILLALIDYGIINFVKVSEADFGSEDVWYIPCANDSKPKQRKKFSK